jgi:o-succinylbenzoate synthase
MVKIATLDFHRYSRPLQIPLVTARQTVSQREGLIVRVVAENGVTGLGEAAPLAEYSPDSIDQSERNLTLAAKRSAAKAVPDSLDDISTLVGELIPADNPAARFGLETSLCDAAARCARQSLCRWLGGEDVATIRINYLLDRPVADWRAAADDIKRFGYRAVKVKVGIGSISEDAAFVRRARVELGDDVAIRLDANRAWSYNDAVTALEAIKDIGIEFVEEPLRQSDLGLLPQLRGKTGVPVALDESMAETLFHRGIDAIDMIMTKEMCDLIILKPTVLGGIFPAIQLAQSGRRHGIPIVVTSTLETEIGLAALLQLAAYLDVRIPCGLDTLRLFSSGDAAMRTVTDGAIRVPAGLGIGIETWVAKGS